MPFGPLVYQVRTPASQAGHAGFKSRRGHQFACLVELVYTSGLRSDAVRIGGSSPSAGTTCACDGTVYVSGSNPGARHGLVSSNLTSRTKYRTGVMGAHLALTQEDEDRNLGAVPKQICRMMSAGADTGLENRGQQRCCGDRHLRPAPYGVIP